MAASARLTRRGRTVRKDGVVGSVPHPITKCVVATALPMFCAYHCVVGPQVLKSVIVPTDCHALCVPSR